MKKFLVVATVFLLALTGCKNKSEKIQSKYGDQNKDVVNSLNDTKDEKLYFADLMVLDDNTLQTQFGLTVDEVENYVGAVPYILDSRFYVAIKPTSESKDKVKRMLKSYAANLEQRLSDLVTDEDEESKAKLEMIKNHMEKEVNGYYVYISSSDNEKVLKIIEKKLEK